MIVSFSVRDKRDSLDFTLSLESPNKENLNFLDPHNHNGVTKNRSFGDL